MKNIILQLNYGSMNHIDKDLIYESDNKIIHEEKDKFINFLLEDLNGWKHISSDIEKQKNILKHLEPFEINLSIMQWFPAGIEEDQENKYHLWCIMLNIKAPKEIQEVFMEPLGKDPIFQELFGDEENDSIHCSSEFMEIDQIKNLLKKLSPEFEITYIDVPK